MERGQTVRKIWPELSPEQKTMWTRIAGLFVAALTVFTLIACVSYLFTWRADASLPSEADMMARSVSVENAGAKLGYRWGHFLVGECFGLGAFAFIFILVVLSVRLLLGRRLYSLPKGLAVTVSGAFLVSFIAAWISRTFGWDGLLSGGLGGAAGAEAVSWGVNLVGPVFTAVLLLVFALVWLLFVSRSFFNWFVGLGSVRESAPEEEDPVPVEDAPEEPSWLQTFSDPPAALPVEAPEEVAETVPSPEVPEAVPEEGPAGKTEEGDDVSLTVIQGDELSTKVYKELPRIDTREELQNYQFPSLDLLDDYANGRYKVPADEIERNKNKIKVTLANYKIQIESVTAILGPTVTLYKITLAPGVKISAVRNLDEDIAVALHARGVRVVTLPDAVGIEVANDRASIVPLKSLLNSDAFRESKAELPVAIGYTITQDVKVFDLADAPHLLVAGATKMGKSVGLNVIITSLLYAKHPSELKLVFIDPKMVEFSAYARLLKHYLAALPTAANAENEQQSAIVKSAKDAAAVLKSLCVEMDERYALMSKAMVNNVKLYNDKFRDRYLLPTEGHRFMPYIVVVIDEYADLIMSGGSGPEDRNQAKSVQTSIIRLAQKGRAAGLHVIIATQRPSVNVITGLIKANFPTRIAFRVTTGIDSRTILDTPGAEKLIGRGDMLYYAGVEMERVQCALVEMKEINRITEAIGSQTGYKACYNTPYYLPAPEPEQSEDGGGMVDMKNLDERFVEAARQVVLSQRGSTSDLQRKLGMGYAKAGRVMDQLEAAGIVGPQDGSKPRQVLVQSMEELQRILDAYMA